MSEHETAWAEFVKLAAGESPPISSAGEGEDDDPTGEAVSSSRPSLLRRLARAPGWYVKDLAGYGANGPFQGQTLLDSTSVKPRLSLEAYTEALKNVKNPAEREKVLADLRSKYETPGWFSRNVPMVDRLARIGNAIDRTPYVHPLVQLGKSTGYLATVPFTRPFTRMAERGLRAKGQKALANTLYGTDKAIQLGNVALTAATLGSVGAFLYSQLRNQPARQLGNIVANIPGSARDWRANPEVAKLINDPAEAAAVVGDLAPVVGRDKSDIAQLARSLGYRSIIPTMRDQADITAYKFKNEEIPWWIDKFRQLTPGGVAIHSAIKSIARPIDPDEQKEMVREELGKYLPRIWENLDENLTSPTGQRVQKAVTHALQRPAFAGEVKPHERWPGVYTSGGVAAEGFYQAQRQGMRDPWPFVLGTLGGDATRYYQGQAAQGKLTGVLDELKRIGKDPDRAVGRQELVKEFIDKAAPRSWNMPNGPPPQDNNWWLPWVAGAGAVGAGALGAVGLHNWLDTPPPTKKRPRAVDEAVGSDPDDNEIQEKRAAWAEFSTLLDHG